MAIKLPWKVQEKKKSVILLVLPWRPLSSKGTQHWAFLKQLCSYKQHKVVEIGPIPTKFQNHFDTTWPKKTENKKAIKLTKARAGAPERCRESRRR